MIVFFNSTTSISFFFNNFYFFLFSFVSEKNIIASSIFIMASLNPCKIILIINLFSICVDCLFVQVVIFLGSWFSMVSWTTEYYGAVDPIQSPHFAAFPPVEVEQKAGWVCMDTISAKVVHWVTLPYCIQVGWQRSLPFSLPDIFPVKAGLQLHHPVGPGKGYKLNFLLDSTATGGVGEGRSDTPLCCCKWTQKPVPHWVLLTPRERGAEQPLLWCQVEMKAQLSIGSHSQGLGTL